MRQHLASLDTSTAYLATHPHASFELTPLGPTFPSFSPISYASFIHSLPSPPSPPPSYSPPAPPLYHYGAQETSERGSSPESILSLETPAGSPEHVNLEGTTYGTYGGAEGYGRRVKEEEVDDKGFQSVSPGFSCFCFARGVADGDGGMGIRRERRGVARLDRAGGVCE
jgi:hypothetical protein